MTRFLSFNLLMGSANKNCEVEPTVRMIDGECSIRVKDDDHLLEQVIRPEFRLHIDFDDLSYSVCHRKEKSKQILRNISGSFRAGRLTSIIGPSGAGKSSLLSIISTLKSTNIRGVITVNGVEWKGGAFRKHTCFVPQDFALFPRLTTRETLYIAARLKLEGERGSSAPHLVVKETAENLGLTNCLDTLVERLSGGERKRLSIGVEIITKPSVLLLDEPTSGLDSVSSNQVINVLKKMARAGCTVACAIHQPSCKIISQLDDVLVLHNGKCFYCGPWDEILSTLTSGGFACPPFYNIAEFVIEVVTGERGGDLENLHKISLSKYQELKTRLNERLEIGADSSVAPAERHVNNFGNVSKKLSSWQQQKVLFLRAMICIKRDNTMTKLRFAAHVVVAFLLGFVFYDSGNDAARTNSNIACVFFILLFLYFSSSMPAVQMFPTEAAVFIREYMNNWYNIGSYYAVKIVSDLPIQILAPSIFISIIYYMTGQPMECQRFLRTWIICVLTTILGQSSGILTGVAFNTHIGVFLIPALSIPLILFAGFFLKFSEVTLYLRPFCAISFFRYAFEGIVQAIYDGDRENLPCYDAFCYQRSPKKILEFLDMPTIPYYITVLMICVWIICLQMLVFCMLKWKCLSASR